MVTFIVTNTNDSGAGSLRQAVLHANALPGADVVGFNASFNSEIGDIIRLTSGEVHITDTLTIDGGRGVTITGDANGDDVTLAGAITDVVASLGDADRLDDNSRIFDATAALTIDGLTLTGGRTTADFEGGGAVHGTAALTLIDSVVRGNSTAGASAHGGGVFGEVSGGPSVTVINSTISGNSTAGYFAHGGGINGNGIVAVTDSRVSDNATAGTTARGGGLSAPSITVTDSTVSGNSTAGHDANGGGVNGDIVTVTNSTIRGNSTAGGLAAGGGISAYSYANVTGSTVSDNSTAGDHAYGGGITAFATVNVSHSTVSGNSTAGLGAQGGGIAAGAVVLTSTLSGNSTAGSGAQGGGIWAEKVMVTSSTISGNSTAGADADGGGIMAVDDFRGDGQLHIANSLLFGNATSFAGVGGDEFRAGALVLTGGNIVGNNLFSGSTDVGDTTAAAVFAATVTVAGAQAGVLADNGGPTETIALNADASNPAIGGADQGP